MSQDRVRYLKLLVYEGPRDIIEKHIKHTVFGIKTLTDHSDPERKEYSITGYALVAFPEILLPVEDITENNVEFVGKQNENDA